jgi:transposase InsO family protein
MLRRVFEAKKNIARARLYVSAMGLYEMQVNGKRVRRLMTELGIHGTLPVRRKRTTDSTHDFPRFGNLVEGLEVVRPDQVWVADITYIRLRRDFVYLAVVMDVFTRLIRGWHLGRDLAGTLTLTALDRALQWHRPEIHHSDQGVQYAATDYVTRLESLPEAVGYHWFEWSDEPKEGRFDGENSNYGFVNIQDEVYEEFAQAARAANQAAIEAHRKSAKP